MISGIFFGLMAAFFQSVSYLFSKRYVARFEPSGLGLLVFGHIIMGIFSLAMLPFLWPAAMPAFIHYVLPLSGCVVFYLGGQLFLIWTLNDTDASRVSPLLGLKILILAALTGIFANQHYHALQWTAIAAGAFAAYLLGMLGREMTVKNWAWILITCLLYSLSDMNIKIIIGRFPDLGLFHASMLCACLCYLFCGIAACAALPFVRGVRFAKWKASFPWALSWFAGILLLFACFGFIGVVFGNIVQSTRGLMSILMGSLVAYKGYVHIEEKVTLRATLWRLFAGTLMIAAIVLFYSGQK